MITVASVNLGVLGRPLLNTRTISRRQLLLEVLLLCDRQRWLRILVALDKWSQFVANSTYSNATLSLRTCERIVRVRQRSKIWIRHNLGRLHASSRFYWS